MTMQPLKGIFSLKEARDRRTRNRNLTETLLEIHDLSDVELIYPKRTWFNFKILSFVQPLVDVFYENKIFDEEKIFEIVNNMEINQDKDTAKLVIPSNIDIEIKAVQYRPPEY